jgi:hypothetical protein
MERQLRMGGGIMNVTPRQQYGLGSFIKKAVKGVTKGVKKFAKSDLGKAALLAGGAYFAPAMFGGTAGFGAGSTYGNFARGLMSPNLIGPMTKAGSIGRGISSAVTGNAGMIGASVLGASVLGGVLGSMTPQEQEEVSTGTNVAALEGKLTKTYTDLGYDPAKIPGLVANDLSEYTNRTGAMYGGRIGYGDGSGDMILPMRKPETEKMLTYEEAQARNPEMFVDTTTRGLTRNEPIANLIEKYNTYNKAMPGVADYTKKYLIEDFKESLENSGISIEEFNMRLQEQNEMDEPVDMAYGGRIGYAFGTDSPENNAIQAAGIEGLPLNQNPAGVTELDLRDSGGFIPPVGVKEKADDIPAMLANNEFVFTADAVRGMGEGNVNKGAQRMYDMMKKLEKGGRV